MEVVKASLSDEMDNVRCCKEDIARRFWELGACLNHIKEKELYLERFHFFEECVNELGFSLRSAERYMKIACEISDSVVSKLSLRQWDMVLPLDDDQREEVVKKVEDVRGVKGFVSDRDFRGVVSGVKKDLSDADFQSFFELEIQQANLLRRLGVVVEDLKVYRARFEVVRSTDKFSCYPGRQKLLGVDGDVCKLVGLVR